jgi:hypothetical protein
MEAEDGTLAIKVEIVGVDCYVPHCLVSQIKNEVKN